MDQAYEDLVKALAALDVPSKYDRFTILEATYKTVNQNTQIDTHLLVPKSLLEKDQKPRKCPLIVRIHGGYLVSVNVFIPMVTF